MDSVGTVGVASLATAYAGRALPLTDGEAAFRYRRDGSGRFALAAEVQRLVSDGRAWPAGRYSATVYGRGARVERVAVAADTVELALAAPFVEALAGARPALAQWLAEARPQGTLENLALAYRPGAPWPQGLALTTGIRDLALARSGSRPGVAGLSGRITTTGTSGHARLASGRLTADLTHLFRFPFSFDRARGGIRWQRQDADWRLDLDGLELANDDLHLRLRGDLRLPAGHAPYLRLFGELRDGDIGAVPRYLPAAIMYDDTVRWLDRGLVSGRIPSAALLFHGAVDEFPFDHGNGRFEVRAQGVDGIVDYQAGWPRLEEIAADVIFDGRTMAIHSNSAKLLSSDLREVTATIPDLNARDPALTIRGRALGPAQDGMRVLLQTPLRRRFEDHLAGTTVGGPLETALDFTYLLGSHALSLDGVVGFAGNAIDFGPWDLTLGGVDGDLHLTHTGFDASGIRATLRGLPVQLDLATHERSGDTVLAIGVEGVADPASLAAAWHRPAPAWLEGSTAWEARLDLPLEDTGSRRPTAVTLRSRLEGLAVNLPAPLGKPAAEARALRIDTEPGPGAWRVRFDYGEDLRGVVLVDPAADPPAVLRGGIRFGGGEPELHDTGVALRGTVPELPLDAWLTTLGAHRRGPGAAGGPDLLDTVDLVDVRVGAVEVLGERTADLHLVARRPPRGGWTLELSSPPLDGSVSIPPDLGAEPLVADLRRLHLTLPGEADTRVRPWDPRKLPALTLRCADLKVGDVALGAVRLRAARHPRGLRIQELTTTGELLSSEASGEWLVADGAPVSRFDLRMRTPDLGATLPRLGYNASGLEGGRARVSLDAAWAGAPMELSLERVRGELALDIRDGRLTDLDPGAGRIFGLLSVQALPRRLKLDFRDLFQRGMRYDRIEGRFTLAGGDAYTNDLRMVTPSAEVAIAGRVGLARQDYDQLVTVIPDMSATLPVAGAIAGGPIGAAVGAAAAFLTEKLLNRNLGSAIQSQYTITGPWSDPVIEKLTADDDPEEPAGATPPLVAE